MNSGGQRQAQRALWLWAAVWTSWGLACRQDAPPGHPLAPSLFADATAEAAVAFVHRSGATGRYRLPEIMGGGAGFLDYDGDGHLDIYLVQSGAWPGDPGAGASPPGNRLYRNTGNGRFEDVTDRSGVGDAGYGMGCAAGDIDNDGDLDLYVTNFGANVLYRNEGQGRFRDVSQASGVADAAWSSSAAFVDIDHDGHLDLFVANYVAWTDSADFMDKSCFGMHGARDYCSPQAYAAPAFDRLYRNNGDGTFEDVSRVAGIAAKPGTGLGVVGSDLNDDGWLDIYVANDQMPSFAWINRGDGTFVESAVLLGCAVDDLGKSQAGMGVDAVDINNDAAVDLWKVHLHRESHILYINRGTFFDDKTAAWGLAAPTRRYTGFGTALFDYDLDGLLDAFVANGRVQFVIEALSLADVYAEPNQLLRQERSGRFVDVTAQVTPFMLTETSRAAAFGDYDNDGDIDIVVVNRDGPARIFRNDAPRLGAYAMFRVIGAHGRDAIGARLQCRVAGGLRMREVRAAYGYCATHDPRVHLGLGAAREVHDIEVRWPDGTVERFGTRPADQLIELRRGHGDVQARPMPPG